jgi:hypothetical protein
VELAPGAVNMVLHSIKLRHACLATNSVQQPLDGWHRSSRGTMCFGPVMHSQMSSRRRTLL